MKAGTLLFAATMLVACQPTRTPAGSETVRPPLPSPDGASGTWTWTFDRDSTGVPPSGFQFGLTGRGAQGRWIVQAEADAPTKPNVLAQLDADDTDYRFPVAVATEPVLRDVAVTVRCKMISGTVDQACGLVLRFRDANNYYVTRANALEDDIRLYRVKDGKRKQLASWSGTVTGSVWHEYRFEAHGEQLTVSWDGRKVLEHRDATFAEAGRVGVWTKADSVSYFDDLRVEAR